MNLTHHFLLSMPQMRDTRFEQSLIYILEHDVEGAWGVVINQQLDMTLREVFSQLNISPVSELCAEETILKGGPVDTQHGLVLHLPESSFESTRHFDGGVSLSSSRDVLEALAAGEEPAEHLVLLGHAGWGPGQLENEVADNAWLTCEADLDIIFNTPVSQMRAEVAGLIGINLHQIVGQSGHAWIEVPSHPPLTNGDYLCFDYGTVRIGLAVGNTLLGTAQPLQVIANNSGTPQWTDVDQVVKEWAPAGMVVGIPLTVEGEVQEITHHARGFLKRLKKRYDTPVFSADERFSSIEAQQELKNMRARGQRGKTQHADVDTLAAALILERWFTDQLFEDR